MKINKLLFSLLFSIVFLQPSVSYSSVPDYIKKDTLDNICKFSECSSELKKQYKDNYFVKQMSKAFVISYEINKITNKYKIVSLGLSYEASHSSVAKNDAIKECKKNTKVQIDSNKYCQLLFVNNLVDENTYINLTNKPSSTGTGETKEDDCPRFLIEIAIDDYEDDEVCLYAKKIFPHTCYIDEAINRELSCGGLITLLPEIPDNAQKDGTSWTCNTDYYKNSSLTGCIQVPSNGTKWQSDLGFSCNYPDYKKSSSGQSCSLISTGSIPDNAQAVGNSWACDEFFWKVGKKCESVPEGVYSGTKSNTGKCINGYENNADNNGCNLIIPANSSVVGTSWACDYSYYKVNLECKKVPNNGFSASKTNTWYCKSGYEKNQNRDSCISQTPIDTKPTPPRSEPKDNDDYKTEIIIMIVGFIAWLFYWISSSNSTPRTQRRPTPRTQPQSKPTPIPKPQPTHPSKYKPPLKPRPKVVQRSQPKPAPKTQPKQAPKTQPKHVNRIKDLPALLNKIGNHNCRELTNEFREWNGKILLAKTTEESKDIQKILDFIAKRREDNNC